MAVNGCEVHWLINMFLLMLVCGIFAISFVLAAIFPAYSLTLDISHVEVNKTEVCLEETVNILVVVAVAIAFVVVLVCSS